jgi:hypothetical protein
MIEAKSFRSGGVSPAISATVVDGKNAGGTPALQHRCLSSALLQL